MKAAGGCLCGQIHYQVDADTFMAVSCHCGIASTSREPAVVVTFPSAAVHTVKGQARVFQSTANSGTRVYRSFCPDCGTSLSAGNDDHPESIAVKVGSLDNPSGYAPAFHLGFFGAAVASH